MQHIQHSHMNQSRNKISQNMPNQNYQNNTHQYYDKQHNQGPYQKAQICRHWMNGNCFRGENCRFDGDFCLFWPQCKYAHGDMCRFQEHCSRQDCPFMHKNGDFLEAGRSIQAPNIHSYQDFPQFPQQKRRWW